MSFITLSEAQTMIATYQQERPNMLKSGYSTDVLPLNITFSKSEVLDLLDQSGCASARVYFGMQDRDNLIDLVIVAVDENGDDIIPETDYLLLDQGIRCPQNCPSASVLTP